VDDGAPTDAPVVDGSVDGMAVDAPTTCPADFTTMTGGQAGHVYRLVDQVQNWQAQTSFCAGTSTQAYLAIPDDLAELQAIAVRSGVPQSWVGITDQAVEGTFLTVKGVPAVFLPWDTGQPDDAGPGEDCVIIQTQTSKLRDERCSTKFKAVCECDP
jgi:hypothetical protein